MQGIRQPTRKKKTERTKEALKWLNENSYAAVLGVLFAHLTPTWLFRWHLVMFYVIITVI